MIWEPKGQTLTIKANPRVGRFCGAHSRRIAIHSTSFDLTGSFGAWISLGASLAGFHCRNRWLKSAMMQMSVFMLVLLASGCTTTRYLSMRDVRDNALATSLGLGAKEGPEISERTLNTLRRFALEDRYQADAGKCFAHIRKRVNEHPD